jgi:hypothetical protein
MRLSTFTAQRDFKRAITEIKKLPDEAWSQYPGIAADAFVVFTKTDNIPAADALVGRIPESEMARDDVADALGAYRAREAAKAPPPTPADSQGTGEPAPTPSGASSASSAVAPAVAAASAAPVGTPVEAPDDALDSRIKSGQGSFSGAADPVSDALARSKKLVRDGDPAEAARVIRDGLRKNPESRELRLAMIEAACLARDWRTAVAQIPVVDPFKAGEERYMFYASASLYEVGRKDEAKPLMKRALPKLMPSPFVDHYSKVVLAE